MIYAAGMSKHSCHFPPARLIKDGIRICAPYAFSCLDSPILKMVLTQPEECFLCAWRECIDNPLNDANWARAALLRDNRKRSISEDAFTAMNVARGNDATPFAIEIGDTPRAALVWHASQR